MVPEATGEFFALYFFPCPAWGEGNFCGRCGIQEAWGAGGGKIPPCEDVDRGGAENKLDLLIHA